MAGANRSMYQLILELRDMYEVLPFVLLPYGNSKGRTLKNFLLESQIDYRECNIPFFKMPSVTREYRLNYIHYLREIEALAEQLKPMNFDLVHSNSSVIDFGGYISRTLGIKHVWHLRDFGEKDYNLHSIWGGLYGKATYKNGDAFIAISNAIKKYFEKGIPSDRIHTIYNGIKIAENVPLAKHENEIVQFICAGVICEAKNQLEIEEAINILVNKRNIKNLHLTIVGAGGGGYLKNLKSYAEDNGISNYISFLGEVDGIAQLASTMDVGIMSSHCEAFGRTTVEYMLQNLAVIANDNGANTEIITDDQTGLTYTHGSAYSLADEMQKLIDNRDLLINLAQEGRKEALKRFRSEENTRLIYNLYQTILKSPLKVKSNKFFSPKSIITLKHCKDVLMQRLNTTFQ